VRRRDFVALAGGAAVAWPLATYAQQPSLPVVGFLHSASQHGPFGETLPVFLEGLAADGFKAGRDVAIEERWAEGKFDRLPALAGELVARRVNVIGGVCAAVDRGGQGGDDHNPHRLCQRGLTR